MPSFLISANKRPLLWTILCVIAVAAMALYGYERWGASQSDPRNELLAQMPDAATGVLYIDLDALRTSPFLAELYKWAPPSRADADYTQFLQSTGFNYETDLHRVCIAMLNNGQDTTLYAVAEGRFDQKKISAYASQTGTRESRNGREIFSVPVNGGTRHVSFSFLRKDRIALTNGATLESTPSPAALDSDAQAWSARFRRLDGSPVFAVIRQDRVNAALGAPAHSVLQSPQVVSVLNQLQWITVAGKPDADRLRVILEGEGNASAPTRQVSDMLNGLLLLAQVGLNEPKTRQQLPPDAREAYLEMLKSADVSQIDRGETKSVRLIFDVTPRFLEAARTSLPLAPATPENKSVPKKNPASKGTIRN